MSTKTTKHKCTLDLKDPFMEKLKWYERIRLISHDNPCGLSYFRSDVSVREERYRHLRTSKFSIHPFSTLRGWYELFLVYLYFSVILMKPFDAAFMNQDHIHHSSAFNIYVIFTDALCWLDIIVNFFTGYEIPKSKTVELRVGYITKNYVLGPYFFIDVISSIPKAALFFIDEDDKHIIAFGLVATMGLFKVVRIPSFMNCINRSAMFFNIEARGKLFLLTSTVVSFLIIHFMGCMQFFVSKIRSAFRMNLRDQVWFVKAGLHHQPPLGQYLHSLFKSSAYILGIKIHLYPVKLPEECILAIFTYILGKILIAFIWIILAVAILNSRLIEIKYEEMINELEEYMKQKQLPPNLRGKLLQYFSFKYRHRYFKENLINSLLSENLRNEANLHVCKSLIKNVSLFAELDPTQLKKVVDCLILEIFMPNDTIIHAGTLGDAMYFLSSGTVAVYSHSGREICHMQDGAYFGEISLLLKGQLRSATIVALETSQIYRLNKKDFEKCLVTNKEVKTKMLQFAESRLKLTTQLDEEYKEKLFEESYKTITPKS